MEIRPFGDHIVLKQMEAPKMMGGVHLPEREACKFLVRLGIMEWPKGAR